MSATFVRGSVVGRGDLDLFTVDNSNQPTNVFEISYAIYDATTGVEVLIGSDMRTPINPDVGEYYAALEIPANARSGLYRLRWRMRETALSAEVIFVEEFTVLENDSVNPLSLYSPIVIDMTRRLRILLRDNCIDGEEIVTVHNGDIGQAFPMSLEDLYNLVETPQKILCYDCHGRPAWEMLEAVHRTLMPPDQDMLRITLEDGTDLNVTSEHRVYKDPLVCVPASSLRVGDALSNGKQIQSITTKPLPPYVYDVTVATNHNLILTNSGVAVHNCPDRNYRFRPPTHEETINRFNRVFGYIWEDYELVEYMERGVDFINLYPPETQFNTIDIMVQAKPAWRQMILMAAMAHALMALSINWISEEFSYSIGGISLDISKSSNYESLKGNAEQQLDKMLEAKTRTVKIMRGLKQSRYGLGVRSAFGPSLSGGVVSPRKYIGV